MIRVKHSTTSTSQYHYYVNLYNNAYTTGGGLGRQSGDASTSTEAYRISTGSSLNEYLASGTYGDTDTWRHLCFVYDASTGTIYYYVDGSLSGSVSSATTFVSSSTANVFFCGAAPGKFADAAFFDRALNSTEVAAMAAYREPQVTSGLIGFWRFDSNANDSSGNSQNLSLAGSGSTPTFSTADNPPQPENPTVNVAGDTTSASTLTGVTVLGKALASDSDSASTFDGTLSISTGVSVAGDATTDSQLTAWIRPRWGRLYTDSSFGFDEFTLPSSDPANGFTMMAWFKAFGTGYLGNFSFSSSFGNIVSIRPYSGIPNFYVQDDGSDVMNLFGTDDMTSWTHLALTYDGSNIRAYVNGSLEGSPVALASFAGDQDMASGTFICHAPGMEVAHAKVWLGSALSTAEISSEMDYHTPHHDEAFLEAWWPLTWQDPTNDASGNGHTLTPNQSAEAQSESPGELLPPYEYILSNSTTTSSLTGTTRLGLAFDGSLASASQLAAALAVAVTLNSAATTSSRLSASLGVERLIAADATTDSALDGTLSAGLVVASDATTSSSLSGTLDVGVPLASGATTDSAVNGTLAVLRLVSGDSATSSLLAGALGVERLVSGDANTQSTLSGTAATGLAFASDALTDSTFAGALSVLRLAAGDSTTASSLSADLGVLRLAAGDLDTQSALVGNVELGLSLTTGATTDSELSATLGVERPVAGSLTSASAFTGTLGIEGEFGGSAVTASYLDGAVLVDLAFAADATTASSLSALLAVAHPLASSADTASSLSGDLTTGVEVAVASDATTSSSLAATLSVLRPIQGSSLTGSSLTADVTTTVNVAGDLSDESSLTGTLSTSQQKSVAGDLTTASSFTSALTTNYKLVGGATSASILSGSARVRLALSSGSVTSTELAGAVDVLSALESAAATSSTLVAELAVAKPVVGTLSTASTFLGNLTPDGSPSPGGGGDAVLGDRGRMAAAGLGRRGQRK